MNEKEPMIFADGFNIYEPNEKTAHFLFGKASINVNKFKAFLDANVNEKGYVNLNFPKSKKNNEPYAVLDTYKPKNILKDDGRSSPTKSGYEGFDEDISQIPF